MSDNQYSEILQLEDIIQQEFEGVSETQARYHLEACLICFDQHKHNSNLPMKLKSNTEESILLRWHDTINENLRKSWRDIQEATEHGATAIAILLVLHRTEYTIVERSVKGPGFDYWLEKENLLEEDDYELFQDKVRLEISGIMNAKKISEIRRRVNLKLKQTKKSDNTNIPALVIVVEFSRPEAHMVFKI